VTTVGDLAQVPVEELGTRFGKHGATMARHACGEDHRPLVVEREAKSVSQERTFPSNIRQLDALKRHLWHMSRGVADRLHRAGCSACTIAVKLRYANFDTLTRQMRLTMPVDDALDIYRSALVLFGRAWQHGRPVRLLGVAARHLSSPPGQLSLW
jgi:DNA polymerase IV